MRIAFTGHRDQVCEPNDLVQLLREFPTALWITGGAEGFDNQVEEFCTTHGIANEVILPDYDRYGRSAPLKRNIQIIKLANLLIACYDGRTTGGTVFTMHKAKAKAKAIPVRIFHPAQSRQLAGTPR